MLTIPPELWTIQQVAQATGMSIRKVRNETHPRGKIPCVRIGRTLRYRPASVHAYLAGLEAEQMTQERAAA